MKLLKGRAKSNPLFDFYLDGAFFNSRRIARATIFPVEIAGRFFAEFHLSSFQAARLRISSLKN
jgi:hypothetical protein